MKFLSVGVLFFSFVTVPMPMATANNSERAFTIFKSLQGNWEIESNGKALPIQMTYEVGSKESIVIERFGKEFSVIYRDSENLLMTHFCNAGNQPRLRLKESRQTGVFEFETFDITNLKDSGAPHVEKIVYKVIDEKRIDLEILWKKGQSEDSETYALSRM